MKHKTTHTELREELKTIAPGLSDMSREDGFIVPHNYFRELPDRVIARLAEEERQSASAKNWLYAIFPRGYTRSVLAFATVLILIVGGTWYFNNQSATEILAGVSQGEALDYVLDNLAEYNSDELLAAGVFSAWDATEMNAINEDDLDQVIDEMMSDDNMIDELLN